MSHPNQQRLLKVNSELIEEGKKVLETQFRVPPYPEYVEIQALHRWWGKIQSFGHQLGSASKPWQSTFEKEPEVNYLSTATRILGVIEAIHHEIENDHLNSFTTLIRAETMIDLLEQADHLFQAGYSLAAGVIGRAVLEEHLRSTCSSLSLSPSRKRPTIDDYNQLLYTNSHYSKTKMKHIDTLASIGNDAAHNKPNLEGDEVRKLLRDLPEIIESTKV